MQVQRVYKEVADKFSNTVADKDIRKNVGGLIFYVLLNEEQVQSGHLVIKAPKELLQRLGIPPVLQQRAKEQFAKDNRIPVGDVQMLISMWFALNPKAKQAEVHLYVLLRDQQQRVKPMFLGPMKIQQVYVALEKIDPNPDHYRGFKDFGGDYDWR